MLTVNIILSGPRYATQKVSSIKCRNPHNESETSLTN
jgi:hypothetical protein